MKQIPTESVARGELWMLGVDARSLDLELLGAWAMALMERSSTANLVGPEEMDRLWRRHVLESAAYALLLDRDLPVVDAGSGCGLPGVPLALMGYDVTLLEPRRKRYLFLRYCVERLGVPARAVRGRLEDWAPGAPAGCQFVCRALRRPEGMKELLGSYPHSGGSLTMRRPPSVREGEASQVRELPVPPLDRRGVLVQFRLPEAPGRP